MQNLVSIVVSSTAMLVFFAACAMLFATCGLLIGAVLTFGKVSKLDAKIILLERITANQHHVIQCLKSALELALNYISKSSSAEANFAKNWAEAVERDSADLPYFVKDKIAAGDHSPKQ